MLHLAHTPLDMAACRRRLEFRHVLIVFRDTDAAWPGWQELFDRANEATKHPEWNVARERRWREQDGFRVVWLELGPPEAQLARGGR